MSAAATVVESILGGSGATLLTILSPKYVSWRRRLANRVRQDAAAEATASDTRLRQIDKRQDIQDKQLARQDRELAELRRRTESAEQKAEDAEEYIDLVVQVLRENHLEVPPRRPRTPPLEES